VPDPKAKEGKKKLAVNIGISNGAKTELLQGLKKAIRCAAVGRDCRGMRSDCRGGNSATSTLTFGYQIGAL